MLRTGFDLTLDLTSNAETHSAKKQKTVRAAEVSMEDLIFPLFTEYQLDDLDMIDKLFGSSTSECAAATDLDLGLDFLEEEENTGCLTEQDLDSFLAVLA